jgi:hypothetical protein
MRENVVNRPRVSTHGIPLPLCTQKPTAGCIVVDRIDGDAKGPGLVVASVEAGDAVGVAGVSDGVVSGAAVDGGDDCGGANGVKEEEEGLMKIWSCSTVGLLAAQLATAVETTDGLLQKPTYVEQSMA